MEPMSRQVEFRGGKRLVPEYLADMMLGIETIKYTYEEAVVEANRRLVADRINAATRDVINKMKLPY